MLETVRIRREGYAFRPPFDEFVERYKTIAASPKMAVSASNCRKILQAAKLQDYQVGKTKVFLKYWHVDKLNELLERVHKAAAILQKIARGFVQRRKFRVLLAAKREQEKRVAEFLSKLPMGGDQLYSKQKELCRADESRPKEVLSVAPKLTTSPKRVQPISPPSDINAPPPEPKITGDSVSDLGHNSTASLIQSNSLVKSHDFTPLPFTSQDEEEEEDLFDEEGDKFVAPSKNVRFRRFGQEGTRNA